MLSGSAAPATPPVAPPAGMTFAPPPFVHFTNQTLRQIVRTSVGGSRLRVVLSNTFGTAPLTIGAAHIALREKDDAIQAGQGRPLTFSGRSTITIPANAIVYSDPVALTVPPLSDLAVDVYLPGTTNYAGAARDAHLGVPDVLHLRNGQSRRHAEAADRCDHAQLVSVVAG